MSEQQPLNNCVDDSVNVARTIEEKPDGNIASCGHDLKQPVTGESSDLDPKKKSFQITSVELDYGTVEKLDEGLYGDNLQQSAENIAALEQNSTSKTDTISSNVQPKKKISFQVTSIQSTEGRCRGDSNGYDDVDELNESEFLEEEEESPESTLSHASGNGNGTSRFKVVKIPRYDSKPYTRGRWRCCDFVKFPPPYAVSLLNYLQGFTSEMSEKSDQDSVISGQNSVLSSVSSGLISEGTSSNLDLLGQEDNVLQETQTYEEKNPIKIDFAGNTPLRVDERRDLVINNSSGLDKSLESLPTQSVGVLADESTLRLQDLSEDEVVAEKIKKAMNQVVQIKTDLLQDVNADVQKLKQTIKQLTSENHRLKEENESLKQKLSNQPKTENI